MNPGKRVLIVGGIALALWGMSYGLWYAVFAEHQALDGIGSSLAAGFGDAAQRKGESSATHLSQCSALNRKPMPRVHSTDWRIRILAMKGWSCFSQRSRSLASCRFRYLTSNRLQ